MRERDPCKCPHKSWKVVKEPPFEGGMWRRCKGCGAMQKRRPGGVFPADYKFEIDGVDITPHVVDFSFGPVPAPPQVPPSSPRPPRKPLVLPEKADEVGGLPVEDDEDVPEEER